MNSRLEGFILVATKISILALAFIGVVIYPNVLYPDVFTKGLYVRLLITIAGVGFVWLLALRTVHFPKMTSLAWAVVAFFGALLVSMFASPGIYRSFWGEAQRMEGVFGLLHYGALFFVARAVFKKEDWLKYFKLVILTVPFLVFYAFLQYTSVRSGSSFPFIYNPSESPGSLFGNPAFFSMFLIFAAGFGALVYAMETKKSWKTFSLIAIALSLGVIVWLGIRGEVLGVLVGTLVFWGFWAFLRGGRNARNKFLALLLVLVIGAGALVAFRTSFYDYYPRLIQRMVNLPHEDSFTTRWLSLQSSWKAFLDSPKTIAIGWGQEHFMTGYNKYYDPRHGAIEDVWFDRAHNKLADVFVTGGALGMLTYFALFAILAWYLVRLQRKKELQFIVIAAAALFVAYIVQNLTLFDLPQSYVNFFLVMAFLDGIFADQKEHLRGNVGEAQKGKRIFFVFVGGGVMFTVGALFLIAYTIVIPLLQSRLYMYYFRTHKGSELVENWDRIFQPRNFAHYTLIDDFWRRMSAQDGFRDVALRPITDKFIDELEYVVRREPTDAAMLLRLANVYTERAIGLDSQDDYKKGEEYVRRAIALSPARQESYYLLAFNLQGQKRTEEAVQVARDAVAFNPTTRKAHYTLGINLALVGDFKGAVEELESVRKRGWFSSFQGKDIGNIVKIYTAAGRQDLIVPLLEDVTNAGIVKDKEYFIRILRDHIQKQDAAGVERWTNIYEKAYPEFTSDMNVVRAFLQKGDWAALKKL